MTPDCIAIARRLAKDGAAVVASDINENGGHETVRLIEGAGGRAVFFRTDVRDEQQVRDWLLSAPLLGSPPILSLVIFTSSVPFETIFLRRMVTSLPAPLLP